MLKQLIEYECPTCNAEYGAYPDKAGTNHNCGFCKTDFTIPVGLAPRLVSVGGTSQEELPCEETSLVPARRESPRHLPSVPDARYPVARQDDDKPVKLRFRDAEMELEVDKPTRNAMAMGFCGAVLALLGVIVAAMFGIKKRS